MAARTGTANVLQMMNTTTSQNEYRRPAIPTRPDIYDRACVHLHGFHEIEFNGVQGKDMLLRWSSDSSQIEVRQQSAQGLVISFNEIEQGRKASIRTSQGLSFGFRTTGGLKRVFVPTEAGGGGSQDAVPPARICITCEPLQIISDMRKLGLMVIDLETTMDRISDTITFLGNPGLVDVMPRKLPAPRLADELALRSIFDQTDFALGTFGLPLSERVQYFNGSLFSLGGRLFLFSRQRRFLQPPPGLTPTAHVDASPVSSLSLFSVSSDLRITGQIPLSIKEEYAGECYDDPRVLVNGDNCYVSCSSYAYVSHDYRIKVLVLDDQFRHMATIKPIYGRNGSSSGGPEKNWTWFVRNGKLFAVYRIEPHTVVEFDWNGNPTSEFISASNIADVWPYGECRMGTNPIFLGDRYHCFFHSHLPYFHNGKTPFLRRQYFMGYYTFEATPPFRIMEVSSTPILAGNVIDERLLPYSPLVVFPCGAVYSEDEFVVSLGLNDERNMYLRVPHNGIITCAVVQSSAPDGSRLT